MGEVREANWVDDTILRFADSMSPVEISQKLGGIVSPEAVASYTQRLLEQRDWLTENQEARIIELKLKRILSQLEEQFTSLDNAKVQTMLLREIGNRLDKRIATRNDDLNTYNQNVGRALAEAVDVYFAYIKGALRDEIDPARWEELSAEAMVHVRSKIAEREAIEA